MINRLLTALAAGAAAAMASTAAHAGQVTIVFQNPGADLPVAGNYTTGGTCNGIAISSIDLCSVDGGGLTYSKDWVSVNAKALAAGQATGLVQDLRPTNSGLAALTVGETSNDDQFQSERQESILFDFSATGPVFLREIDFNAGADRDCANPGSEGPCGTFDLVIDGILSPMFTGLTAIDNMAFAMIAGTTFEIVARGPELAGFAIGSITVSEVPLPGAALLLISGIAGLSFASRRKAAA